MPDDNQQDINTPPTEAQTPEIPTPIQSTDSTPTDVPPVAPEAPRDAVTPVPVEDQNGANKVENQLSESPAPAPPISATPQTQSPAQQDEHGFIKSLLVKAQAKIQFNKQKKLDKIIQLAQKKWMITNNDVQKLLYVSDATATRYLVKLVQQGRLTRVGSPRDAKYQFVR